MTGTMPFQLALLIVLIQQTSGAEDELDRATVLFKHHEEWSNWKLLHAKQYNSTLEELERHLIWLSNKRYIDAHNANSHIFGFKLAMNHLGDVVSYHKVQSQRFFPTVHSTNEFTLLVIVGW